MHASKTGVSAERARSELARGSLWASDDKRASSAGSRPNYAAPSHGSPRLTVARGPPNASVALGRAARGWADSDEESGQARRHETQQAIRTVSPRSNNSQHGQSHSATHAPTHSAPALSAPAHSAPAHSAAKRRSVDSRADSFSDASSLSYREPREAHRDHREASGRPGQVQVQPHQPQQNAKASGSGASERSDWWQTEAKRMRQEALKMRTERDRFRAAVEDAHFECRRLAAQVQEFQSSLRTTQVALREANAVADAARSELERLRLWVEEAHTETKRMSHEVQEYEMQLRQTKATLEEAERSCQEMKIFNDEVSSDNAQYLRKIKDLEESFSSFGMDGTNIIPAVEEARAEREKLRLELDAALTENEDLKQQQSQSDSQLRDIVEENRAFDMERQTLELAVEELKRHVSEETMQEVQQLLNSKFQEQWQDPKMDDADPRGANGGYKAFDNGMDQAPWDVAVLGT